ncbi:MULTISPECIES: cell division protein FtsZ [Campylobacter]|uniref:Cell division protein FtsZ n=1 Tax=Campylobacter curvus (strain 525.92) TaxID=360105 RepID=A7GYY0_CAMC5|nr:MULTISPECIES: cell division protein FtsZ [Campylobacter]EAU00273.1 cell division protein FtsZ [Campylobacter curvus 525.92]EJP74531.1 cell division protein FtsZ [Campylobacter sp. FOBRC14]MBN7288406.1 cell division protein FtsZ [Campylobacter curvus]MDU6827389.1 cell division protein FtsZ [Campylobacter sp.]QKF61410.1 cell division protein FtsZ [Campylobacter curvus]
MSSFTVEENKSIYGAKIKVVGVGGGGGNMINHMIRENAILNIDLIVANTDAQALENSPAHTKIQLGEKKTKGLGAGMRPEVGKEAAEESYDEIKSALETSDIVFIASGLGGGTGTGAAPIVAQAAKDVGALTVAVVTIPFVFEGKKRRKLADLGLEELRKESDSIVVIPNDKLLTLIDKKAGIKESFEMVDDVLARAVNGMSTIVLDSGKSDINLDFADVRTIMSHRGLALMGVGEAQGEDAAQEAMKNAIQSPLLDNMTINGAFGVLVHFRIHPSCPLSDINDAMEIVYSAADEDAEVIFGTTTDDNMENNKVQITIIATGFKGSDKEAEEKKEADMAANEVVKKERILRLQKVSGGYNSEDYMTQLDVPSYMRHQMD